MRSCRAMTFSTVLSLIILASAASVLVSGCGSSSSSNTPVVLSTPQSTYLVEYIPGSMPAMEGKTTFQLKVKNSADGSAASGLTIELTPIMHMADKDHGTPADVVKESATAGTYNCTVYYLMGDHMMGTLMGYWELQVRISSEVVSFYPSVGSQMAGADTWKAAMKSAADVTAGKTYYLFSDGMVTAASPTFKLYISRAENDPPTNFTAISSAATSSLIVTAATDTLFTDGLDASDDGNGHFSMPLSALSTTGTYTVFVKMAVDGDVKTSDGLATNASGTNLYQSFKVTSH